MNTDWIVHQEAIKSLKYFTERNDKKISIVLPVYNGEKYLNQAIESCLNQTYKNFELIIINDNSSDKTKDIINEYAQKDKRIISLKNQNNLGLPKSLNKAFKIATGDYFTWISDDNIFKPDALRYMSDYLFTNENIDLISCAMDFIDEKDNLIKKSNNLKNRQNAGFLASCCNVGGCFLFTKEIFEKINGYDETLECAEDYDFWCRIALNGNIHYRNENFFIYRCHSNSISSTKQDLLRENTLKIHEKYANRILKKYPLKGINLVDVYYNIFKINPFNKSALKKAYKANFVYAFIKHLLYLIRKIGKKSNVQNFHEITITKYSDKRGSLTSLETNKNIPFKIARAYYLKDLSKDGKRACHAHKKSKRVLNLVQGKCRAKLFDGKNTKEFLLTEGKSLYFKNKVWCELSDFDENTIILALADMPYFEEEYIRNYDNYCRYIGVSK